MHSSTCSNALSLSHMYFLDCRTLIKLMAGELIQTMGDIRPHGHLKLGRFTQHFVDVLDLEKTPLEFFEEKYPDDAHEEQRKYLGRFGVSGKMQVQKMSELSDGQKSRVVFAHLGRLRYVQNVK
jgi:ATP-binding cassette, subfamily F, member 2